MGSSLRGVSEAYWLATQPETYPLGEWIADQRDSGVAWRVIASELRERIDGVIDLSGQTLLNWYGDAARQDAA